MHLIDRGLLRDGSARQVGICVDFILYASCSSLANCAARTKIIFDCVWPFLRVVVALCAEASRSLNFAQLSVTDACIPCEKLHDHHLEAYY